MTYLADLTCFDGSMARLWTRPAEACLRWQADMLKAAEPITMDWYKRQRVATGEALFAIEKLSRCNDLSEAASIQREWFDGALTRLITNLETLAEQTKFLSREAVTATRDAVQSVSEAASSPKQPAAPNDTRIDVAA
ncbi:MAG TPA: hypothetical protein VGU20_19875 [Stellaceae bacterium]|nr:hypothetical protein [Stellaceae bacterium]